MVEFFASNWIWFISFTVIMYIVSFFVGSRAMRKNIREMDSFMNSQSSMSNVFNTFSSNNLSLFAIGVVLFISSALSLVAIICSIVQYIAAN